MTTTSEIMPICNNNKIIVLENIFDNIMVAIMSDAAKQIAELNIDNDFFTNFTDLRRDLREEEKIR